MWRLPSRQGTEWFLRRWCLNWNLNEHRECGREFLKLRARDVHMLRPPGRPSWARSWEERTCTCSDHGEDLLGHAPGKKGRAHAPTTGRTFLGTLLGRKAGVYLEPGCQEREKQETGHTGAVCVPDHWRPSRWLQQEVQLYFQSNGKGFQRGSILIRYFLANHLYYIFTSIYHFFSYQTSEPTRDFFPFS